MKSKVSHAHVSLDRSASGEESESRQEGVLAGTIDTYVCLLGFFLKCAALLCVVSMAGCGLLVTQDFHGDFDR